MNYKQFSVFLAILFYAILSPAVADVLTFLNWTNYMDPGLIKKFEAQYKVQVRQLYFESDDSRDAMLLKTDSSSVDVVLLNGSSIAIYNRRGWLAPVNKKQLTHLDLLDAQLRNAFAGAKKYAVPYLWGTLGIAYRKDRVKKPPQRWLDLFQPDEYLRNKINMLDNSRDVIGMALKVLGYSSNSTSKQELKAAELLLRKQKPYVKSYNYVALTKDSSIIKGDVIMAMIFNGDVLTLQKHADIAYVLPKEGSNLWVDYLVVMQNSNNKELAWAFINFLNEPENAAQLAQYVYYATPNTVAKNLLPEEFVNNPVIYPDKQALQLLEVHQPLPARIIKKRNNIFSYISE